QAHNERYHFRYVATAITHVFHLFNQVALALTGNSREGRGQAVAVSTVTGGTGRRFCFTGFGITSVSNGHQSGGNDQANQQVFHHQVQVISEFLDYSEARLTWAWPCS